MALKDPLTVSYVRSTIHPLLGVTDVRLKKKLVTAMDNLAKAEKELLKDPLNEKLSEKMRTCIRDVKAAMLSIKKPDKKQKDEIVKVSKALKKYAKEHDSKVLDKITSKTIGSVPNGMKRFCEFCGKKFTMESYNFLQDTIRAKKEGAGLVSLHKKYVDDINVSHKNSKRWKTAAKEVEAAHKELQKKENKVNKENRVKWVTEHAKWVDELWEATYACRADIQQMMLAEVQQLVNKNYLSTAAN